MISIPFPCLHTGRLKSTMACCAALLHYMHCDRTNLNCHNVDRAKIRVNGYEIPEITCLCYGAMRC